MAEEFLDPSKVPADVQAQVQPAPSTAGIVPTGTEQEISPYELPQDVAAKLLSPAQYHDYQDQKQYGEGVENIVRAGIESGFNQALLGAGDAVLVAAGANAEALRQRRERNEVASAVGGAGGFVLPLLLTGGESAAARVAMEATAEAGVQAGARLGVEGAAKVVGRAAEAARPSIEGLQNAIRFTPTTAGASSLGKAVQGFTERALVDRPVAGKLAGVLARNATEGALYGTGSAITDVVRDGDDVLGDHDTAAEYILYHAATGAGLGAAMGLGIEGAMAGVGGIARKAGEGYRAAREFVTAEPEVAFNAPGSVARAEAAQAKSAEASAAARNARDEADQLNVLPDYLAPKSERQAQGLIEKIVTQQTGDAAGARAATEDVVQRLNRLETARDSIGRVVDDATVDVTAKMTEREKILDTLLDRFSIGRKFRKADAAIRNSQDVASIETIAAVGNDFTSKLKADLVEFRHDPDPKVASLSQRLTKFVDEADLQLRKAAIGEPSKAGAPNRSQQADAFAALDNLKRAVGFARTRMAANAGDIELRNLPGRLQVNYDVLAHVLENPALFGEKVANIQRENNAAWTKWLDVANGFEREFLKTGEYGAGKAASGFGAVGQGDSAKLGSLLDGVIDPKKGLQLQVFTEGLDRSQGLINQLADALQANPEEAAMVNRLKTLTGEIGDHLKDVAETHADLAEYRALQGRIGAREAALEKAGQAGAKAQEAAEVARGKADEAAAEIAEAKAKARGEALDAKASAIRKALNPLATAAVTTGALATGLPWWTVGGAIPLSSVVGQVLSRYSSEKLVAATAAGFRATDNAASKIAEYMTSSKSANVLGKNAAFGGTALAINAKDSRQDQYERVRAAVENAEQDPMAFAQNGPQSMALTRTPMLMGAVMNKRGNAIRFLKSKLPAEFRPLVPAPQADKHPRVDGIQIRSFLRYARAVSNPQSVLEDAQRGIVTPEGMESLRAVYPRIHQQLVSKLFDKLATATEQPSMRDAQNMSLMTGVPMHFTMQPDFIAGYQSVYQQQPVAESEPGASQPYRARNVKAKTPGLYATPSQRIESGQLGSG